MTAEMKVFSTGIDPEDWIPQRFAQPGEGKIPPISWLHVPATAKSLILLMEHRGATAGERIHWLVYDIPVSAAGIPEGGPIPEGAKVGKNDFGSTGYHPPVGDPGHKLQHYDFHLLACDLPNLGLAEGASWEAVKEELRKQRDPGDIAPPPADDPQAVEFHPLGHVIDRAEFSGHFALDTDKPAQ
ncbi:YbhB/YbcL family Raf kinase inhibitor-like protein [Acidithiobacillus sp. CV18-2]|uniref:YbhB/YbcL family Raf kinase inhibitor-like protein n=1 Tax=Igneacidithiobacillus copahuensis TaxID=2724909 RepID=A0AAE2YQ89_9PROT|nr:YbhB/YbcL family Raf kinase inhibitor-like protein [Igneacidithiobacillus copahuensis]MBU2755453.1 YbhB/YbcL family Raf kinase inhibitor-like protein [Acidithiobacillus sp. CV18-3]MBU2757901.1 YbhB/YbcL family Raf kinase inhibitor-like protein [Acidithiobacillus sp. BN09-2]MBU2778179.1 YbhB/YbcL family Raf kinase inhibitor-like protein [Acidithiobacillus sp. CV18-2]MBU2797002.1 YbhB/YbcL family Raf kinase inhibitor-like protein [Acidithiobacillus sp. VAN18-2]MBU2800532.1 YbhB/YbcL family Ra